MKELQGEHANEVMTVTESEVPVKAPQTLMEMASFALQRGDGLDVIEKLMDLQDRYEAKEAKKAFIKAKAAFKASAPEIPKDMTNSQYGSKYTSKGALFGAVSPVLGRYGLDVSFIPEQEKDLIKITCVMTHEQGHSESVTMQAPPDTSGAKNKIQQIKSTKTYLEIATFESITGLASTDSGDDDGNAAGGVVYINDKQKSQIVDMINAKNIDEDAFLKHMKAESIDAIPANLFGKAMTALKKAKGNPDGNN